MRPHLNHANFKPPAPGAWEIESTHLTRPVSRWLEEVFPPAFTEGFRAGTAHYGVLLDYLEQRPVNRFVYTCARAVGAPKSAKGPPPKFIFKLLTKLHPEIRRRIRRVRQVFAGKLWREDVARWENEWKPEILRRNEELQRIDPRTLTTPELVDYLEQCRANLARAVVMHHRLNPVAMVPLGDFLVHARQWTGLSPSDLLPLFRGSSPVSLGATTELAALVSQLRSDPAAIRDLESGDPADALRSITSRKDALGDAARRYIDKVGIRVATGYDVCDLSVGEMPELLLEMVRAAIRQDQSTESLPDAAPQIRERVPAEHRREFDELLEEARATYRIRDERGYLNDAWAAGIVRRAILAAGERLVAQGRLHAADHAFDLTHGELVSSLNGATAPSADEVAAHVEYRTTFTTSDAPRYLGDPPAPPPPADWLPDDAARMARAIEIVMGEMFAVREDTAGKPQVAGLAASPGVITGIARLVIEPPDMAKVREGEILVTRSTAPSYNALLPLIRGIVTDRGGSLSHAALVAREYGIPAVVGCGDATAKIADGAKIRIDGSRGSVEILS